jgi:hypothetical protein
MPDSSLARRLTEIDGAIADWERRIAGAETVPVGEAVEAAVRAAHDLVRAYLQAEGGKPVPGADVDLLEAFRLLAKGDPSWNAIRENLRELVYYRNCVTLGRRDALPAVPERMAVRLARHVFLYLKTRCEREGRL